MTRKARYLCLAAFLSMLMFPVQAFAYGHYAYNYGFDWSVAPFSATGQDFRNTASDANYYQSNRGYIPKFYATAWASAVVQNLGSSALGSMFVATHGNYGSIMPYSTTAAATIYAPPYDYTHISFVTSNFVYPSNMLWGISGSNHYEVLKEVKRLKDVPNMSATKLAVYEGCETGGDPLVDANAIPSSGRHNLLYESIAPNGTAAHGVACAVGFKKEIYIDVVWSGPSSVSYPGDYWSQRFWYYQSRGWSVGNSLKLAKTDVYNNYFSNYWGFDSFNWQGNGSQTY